MKITRQLRDYQQELYTDLKREFSRKFKNVMCQLATGGGKTRIFATITSNALEKEQSVWIIAPRRKLVKQASKELFAEGVQHGIINANSKESRAFNVHVCSRQTLEKRVKQKKILSWPTIIIIDEAHTGLKFQKFLRKEAPENTIFIGFTATPERTDGEPLTSVYESIVYGPELQELVEMGYLKRPRVYKSPPMDEIIQMKFTRSGDLNKKELEEIYHSKKYTYGDEIENYRKNALGRAFICFCASITLSKETAQAFRESGLKVEHLDGEMKDKDIERILKDLGEGRLDGITSVELVTYGLDVPRISCVIILRRTASRALYFQMVGRGLRPQQDFNDCIILDHTDNTDRLAGGHPLAPVEWNFEGDQKKEKVPKNAIEKVENVGKCPHCWYLFAKMKQCKACKVLKNIDEVECRCGCKDLFVVMACRSCGAEKEQKERGPLKKVDGWLVEIKEPTPLKERPPENQRKYQDMISTNVYDYRKTWHEKAEINETALKNLLIVAFELKRSVMWVYHQLTAEEKAVNVSLLSAIQKMEIPEAEKKPYKNGWAHFKRIELEQRMRSA